MDYTITVDLGTWSSVVEAGDIPTGAEDALMLDGLTASWASDVNLFPSQPEPTTLGFQLYVPDKLTGPQLYQGQDVLLTITGPGWNPATAPPFFHFAGRITDVEAEPFRQGLVYMITAVEYLADLAEEKIGAEPWAYPATLREWWRHWEAIAAASDAPIDPRAYTGSFSTGITDRDVDRQTAWDIVVQTLDDSVNLRSAITLQNALWKDGTLGRFWRRFWRTRWERPILAQTYLGTPGSYSFGLAYVGMGVQSAKALPYRLQAVGSGVALFDGPDMDTSGAEAVIVPASAVERAVRWRQDKAAHTNRVRLTGSVLDYDPGFDGVAGDFTREEWVAEHPAAVELRGPVEASRDTRAYQSTSAKILGWMLLGPLERTVPRYAFDSVTILPEALASDAAWPRLFNPPQLGANPDLTLTWDASRDLPALGRLVLLTGIPAAWNLHDRPDFPGRLVGADLEVAAGRIRATAQVIAGVPAPNGLTTEDAVSFSDLVTVGDPTIAELGPITFTELALTGH